MPAEPIAPGWMAVIPRKPWDAWGDQTLVQSPGGNGSERKRPTLLVVDDEIDVLESLRHQFHRTYRVLTSSSGAEAIELLKTQDVEVLLTVLGLRCMAWDVLRSRTSQFISASVLMIFTGCVFIQEVINAVNEGH